MGMMSLFRASTLGRAMNIDASSLQAWRAAWRRRAYWLTGARIRVGAYSPGSRWAR